LKAWDIYLRESPLKIDQANIRGDDPDPLRNSTCPMHAKEHAVFRRDPKVDRSGKVFFFFSVPKVGDNHIVHINI